MPDEQSAHRKFTALSGEVRLWKGAPIRDLDENGRRLAEWSGLEVRQVGRGVMVRLRAQWFQTWWNGEQDDRQAQSLIRIDAPE